MSEEAQEAEGEEAPKQEAPPSEEKGGVSVSEQEQQQQDASGDGEKEGTEFVEFEDPEMEKRFKRIYGHMKQNERLVDNLVKDNKALLTRLDTMEETDAEEKQTAEVDTLKEAKRTALEEGDYDKVMELDDKILDLKVSGKKELDGSKVSKSIEEEHSWLTPERQTMLLEWAHETDGNGNMLRPWSDPGHPKHMRAIEMASSVMNDPEYAKASDADVMAEIDRMMNAVEKSADKKPNASPVLAGDGNARRRSSSKKITLSNEQKLVAQKMGMTDDAYAKAMSKHGAMQ